MLGAPPLDPLRVEITKHGFHGEKPDVIEIVPAALLREATPKAYESDWKIEYNLVFCDFEVTLDAIREGVFNELITELEQKGSVQHYGLEAIPPRTKVYEWATLVRLEVAHRFMAKTDMNTRFSLMFQLFIDSHCAFVVFLRGYHGSYDNIEDEVNFEVTYPYYYRIMYQIPDMRKAFYSTGLLKYLEDSEESDDSEIHHLLMAKVMPFACSNRNHSSMIGDATHDNPALGYVVKQIVSQTIMGYFGGSYRLRFVTRMVLAQWLQIFAQTRHVDFEEFLRKRRHFVHTTVREMLVYQMQFAPILQTVVNSTIGFREYESQIYMSADTVRNAFDKLSDVEWLSFLPSNIIPVNENPSFTENVVGERTMAIVIKKFDDIFRAIEPVLDGHRTMFKKFKLRKASFAANCAAVMKRRLKRVGPKLILKNTRQVIPDPVLDDDQRMSVHIAASYAAQRGDNFFDFSMLKDCGVDKEVYDAFRKAYIQYEAFGKADNSILSNLDVFFDKEEFVRKGKSLVIIHRFCEDFVRFKETVIVPLPVHVGTMQITALRNKMQLSLMDETPRDIGIIYMCRCGRLLTPLHDPAARNGSKNISGVVNASFDIYNGFLHCNKNTIPACKEPAVEIDLIGKALKIRSKTYAFCVVCGVLTTVTADRWNIGPHCGRHDKLESGVFENIRLNAKASIYPDFAKLEQLIRDKLPEPPNTGLVCKCAFCDEFTSSNVGRVTFQMMDTVDKKPKKIVVHACISCDYSIKRRYPHYREMSLALVKGLYHQWDMDDIQATLKRII